MQNNFSNIVFWSIHHSRSLPSKLFYILMFTYVPAGRSVQLKLVETGRGRWLFGSRWLYFRLETSSGVTIVVFWSGCTNARSALFAPSGLITFPSGRRGSWFCGAVYRGDSGCFGGAPTIFVVATLRCVVSVFIYKWC